MLPCVKYLKKPAAGTENQFIGEVHPVLWESSEQVEEGVWQLSGLTDTYIRVYAFAESNLWNRISQVKLTAHHPGRQALTGVIQNIE